VTRSTEAPDPPRGPTLKQALLILAIIVLGLGGLGAKLVLRGSASSAPPATSLAAGEPAAASEHTQIHRVANSDTDVGPGEAESELVSCPPSVR
jgi:hypothetical protein